MLLGSACWVWKAKNSSASNTFKATNRGEQGKRVIDSGCTLKAHVLDNKCSFNEYEDYEGAVLFLGVDPQQNGVAERRNRTLIEAARTMLVDSKLPTTFWAEAVNTACYVLNREIKIYGMQGPKDSEEDSGMKPTEVDESGASDKDGEDDQATRSKFERLLQQEKQTVHPNSTNSINTVSTHVSAAGPSFTNDVHHHQLMLLKLLMHLKEHLFKQFSPFKNAFYTFHLFHIVSSNDDTRIFEPKKVIQALEDPSWVEAMQEEILQFKLQKVWTLVDLPNGKRPIRTKWAFRNKKDKRGIIVRNKARLVTQGYTQEEGINYDEMDVKSSFLYGTNKEEVYVCQPPSFEDLHFLDNVYKVEKALYGLHQAPRAWYETLSTYLIENGFRRGTIDKTLFIKKEKGDILLVQVYVDDIIFGSTKKSLCDKFEGLIHKRFQMSSMGELTFFLGLQVQQMEDGIFISQDKYVAKILKKFDFATVNTISTPMEPNKALVKDEEADNVDVHLYRSMIGSLMYLTASRPDIMFVVCACVRFQVTPKTSHLYVVKRIFRYLKDSDYADASLDRKSTIGGCQFLGKRCYGSKIKCLISLILGQLHDTRFYIDNESNHLYWDNPVIKIHTDHNVADLLTKAFNVSRFKFLVASIGLELKGKFDGKANEGFFVGYSMVSKAMRVFNNRTMIVEGTLNIRFLNNAPNVTRNGPDWLFDVDSLTISMNYVPVVAENQTNGIAGTRDNIVIGQAKKKTEPEQEYILIPICTTDPLISQGPKESEEDVGIKPTEVNVSGASDKDKEDDQATRSEFERLLQQEKQTVHPSSTNNINTVSTLEHIFEQFSPFKNAFALLHVPNVFSIDDTRIFGNAYDDEDVGAKADLNNLENNLNIEAMQEELLQFKLKKVWTLVDLPKGKRAIGTKWVYGNKKDERGIVVRNKARLVAQGYTQEEGIDYDEVFALVARMEAIRLFLAYASFMGFIVYQMDVKSAFLYGIIEEEVYVCQPPSFEDPQFPDKVYKVEKALYGLHQAPRAWYETLSIYLIENGFRRGTIDKTLLIKKDKDDAQEILDEFYGGAHFLLKTSSTPTKTNKALIKDEEVTPKMSHLHVVKRIFRYLKGQPKLGLWYPKDSPFDLGCIDLICVMLELALIGKSSIGGCPISARVWMKGQNNPLIPNLHSHLLNSTIKKPIIVPFSYQPKKTHKPRTTIKTTEISQSSGPINLVADETVYKEWEDRMERAATTASSLDRDRDRWCQDTIWGCRCFILGLRLAFKSNDPPFKMLHTLGSGEGQYETIGIDGTLYNIVRFGEQKKKRDVVS
ncbi:putative ribonuclease H-like domain-containing protein [Tanacetum coccineum]